MTFSLSFGVRFVPTDEELITHYLRNKVTGQPLPLGWDRMVVERDLYGEEATPWMLFTDCDPWQTCVDTLGKVFHNEKVIYVFTKLSKAGRTGKKNKNRTAGCGHWHENSLADPVKNDDGEEIGKKRTFTFKSEESNGRWTMYEYFLEGAGFEGKYDNEYVICKIKRKGGTLVSRTNSSCGATIQSNDQESSLGKRRSVVEEGNQCASKKPRSGSIQITSDAFVDMMDAQQRAELEYPNMHAQQRAELEYPTMHVQRAELEYPMMDAQQRAELEYPMMDAQQRAELEYPNMHAQQMAELEYPMQECIASAAGVDDAHPVQETSNTDTSSLAVIDVNSADAAAALHVPLDAAPLSVEDYTYEDFDILEYFDYPMYESGMDREGEQTYALIEQTSGMGSDPMQDKSQTMMHQQYTTPPTNDTDHPTKVNEGANMACASDDHTHPEDVCIGDIVFDDDISNPNLWFDMDDIEKEFSSNLDTFFAGEIPDRVF